MKEEIQSHSGPSVSGHADADEFMAQSMNDFSFFDDESPRSPVSSPRSTRGSVSSGGDQEPENMGFRDIIETLKAYRKKTKEAFEREREGLGCKAWEVKAGNPHFHWSGKLEIVL